MLVQLELFYFGKGTPGKYACVLVPFLYSLSTIFINVVAIEEPSEKRNLVMNMITQQTTFI